MSNTDEEYRVIPPQDPISIFERSDRNGTTPPCFRSVLSAAFAQDDSPQLAKS